MYLIGEKHPNKEIALHMVERLLRERKKVVTSAEVFQEILHRYSAIDKKQFIEPAFVLLRELAEEFLPITLQDVIEAKQILFQRQKLSSRDCLHLAVMKRNGITEILSFDRAFEQCPGITRYPDLP